MKLNLVLIEYFTNTSWRKLEIDTNDYPLLKGMTEEEAQNHLRIYKEYVKKKEEKLKKQLEKKLEKLQRNR